MTTSQIGSASGPVGSRASRPVAAVRLASDHAELWLPAALAAMSAIGWLPFVLAVVPLPLDGDLAFFLSSLVLSPSFPVNVVLPAAALFCAVLSATLLSATGEAVLLRGINRLRGLALSDRSVDEEAARVWLIGLLAALPAFAVAVALLAMMAAVAPGEYQSPDLGRGPLLVRIALDVWPLFVLQVAAIAIGQAFAAGSVRASVDTGRTSIGLALLVGLRGLLHRPLRRVAIAVAIGVVLAAWLVLTWALLRILWIPIGRQAESGALLTPASAALLVGFVAIWLCLVAGAGMLHAWSSTWWSLEVGVPGMGTPSAGGGDRWT